MQQADSGGQCSSFKKCMAYTDDGKMLLMLKKIDGSDDIFPWDLTKAWEIKEVAVYHFSKRQIMHNKPHDSLSTRTTLSIHKHLTEFLFPL